MFYRAVTPYERYRTYRIAANALSYPLAARERPRATTIAVIFATPSCTICSVTDPGEEESKGPLVWLSTRAGLVILVILGAIVGLRLMSRWIKWLLIAVVVGAVIYLVKSRSSDESSDES